MRRKRSGDLHGAVELWLRALELEPACAPARARLDELRREGVALPPLSPPPSGSNPFVRSDEGGPFTFTPSPFFSGAAASGTPAGGASAATERAVPSGPPGSVSAPALDGGAGAGGAAARDSAPALAQERASKPVARPESQHQAVPAALVPRVSAQGDSDEEIYFEDEAPLPPPDAPAAPPHDPRASLLAQAADRIQLDDHTGALELIERVLAEDPADAAAQELKARCERTLLSMLEGKLGDLSARPRLTIKQEDIVWLNIDHRAGFLLSLVDGRMSYDDLFAVSSMTRLEAARILVKLLEDKAIG